MSAGTEKEPDKLAQDAARALAAGMTYGKWKSLQPVIDPPPRKLPEGFIRQTCEFCNCVFICSDSRKRRFCGDLCRRRAYEKRKCERENEDG